MKHDLLEFRDLFILLTDIPLVNDDAEPETEVDESNKAPEGETEMDENQCCQTADRVEMPYDDHDHGHVVDSIECQTADGETNDRTVSAGKHRKIAKCSRVTDVDEPEVHFVDVVNRTVSAGKHRKFAKRSRVADDDELGVHFVDVIDRTVSAGKRCKFAKRSSVIEDTDDDEEPAEHASSVHGTVSTGKHHKIAKCSRVIDSENDDEELEEHATSVHPDINSETDEIMNGLLGKPRKSEARRKWSEEELYVLKNSFSKFLVGPNLPVWSDIIKLKQQYPVLGKRTKEQIKARFVHLKGTGR